MSKPQLLKIAALVTLTVAQYDAWGNFQYLSYSTTAQVWWP